MVDAPGFPSSSPANATAEEVILRQTGRFGEAEAKPSGFGAPSSITQRWDQQSLGTALAGEGVLRRGSAQQVRCLLRAVMKG